MRLSAYEMTTVVHGAHIDVHPSLNGQTVRVIILAPGGDEGAAEAPAGARPFGTVGIPGKRITFLSRDDAHDR
jgi:hypothetical protein